MSNTSYTSVDRTNPISELITWFETTRKYVNGVNFNSTRARSKRSGSKDQKQCIKVPILPKDKLEMYNLYLQGVGFSEIARKYNRHPSVVSRVVNQLKH